MGVTETAPAPIPTARAAIGPRPRLTRGRLTFSGCTVPGKGGTEVIARKGSRGGGRRVCGPSSRGVASEGFTCTAGTTRLSLGICRRVCGRALRGIIGRTSCRVGGRFCTGVPPAGGSHPSGATTVPSSRTGVARTARTTRGSRVKVGGRFTEASRSTGSARGRVSATRAG